METGYYPIGCEHNENAPWNEDTSTSPITVGVNIQLYKEFIVDVPKNHPSPNTFIREYILSLSYPNNITKENKDILNKKYSLEEIEGWEVGDINIETI